MYYRAVAKCLHPFRFVPDHLKTQEIFKKGDFPDLLKTQEVCEKAVGNDPEAIEYVPDHFKI